MFVNAAMFLCVIMKPDCNLKKKKKTYLKFIPGCSQSCKQLDTSWTGF